MNIIRLDNVKSTLATSASLTINVEKTKELNIKFVSVILSIDDIENVSTLIKLHSISIDILFIPKKYKYIFNESEYFKRLRPQLNEDYKITYY